MRAARATSKLVEEARRELTARKTQSRPSTSTGNISLRRISAPLNKHKPVELTHGSVLAALLLALPNYSHESVSARPRTPMRCGDMNIRVFT